MRPTPTTILILACIICVNFFPVPVDADPFDVYWTSEFCPPDVHTASFEQGAVFTSTIYDGKLIIGGRFAFVGCESANNIAAWDGTNWSALGPGLDEQVWALKVHDNKLIAGGGSEVTGGFVSSWDGVSWASVGGPLNGWVRALGTYNGNIVAGGEFTGAGGVPANRVAEWNGTTWIPLADGITEDHTTSWGPGVYALTVFDDKLIVGGLFNMAGTVPAVNVAAWNGFEWSALGSGFGSYYDFGACNALTVWDNKLIAGGRENDPDGPGWNVASWDDSTWSTMGDNLGTGRSLHVHNDMLIAGGRNSAYVWNGSQWNSIGYVINRGGSRAITTWNGTLTNGLSEWDGVDTWTWLIPGVDGWGITKLREYAGKLIVSGGESTVEIGGVAAEVVAAWDGTNWSAIHNGFSSNGAGEIYDFEIYQGELIVAGSFYGIDHLGDTYKIARWNGSI